MDSLFQIPAQVTKVATLSHRSLRVQLDTQENLTDEQMGKISAMHEKTGWFTFSVEPITPDDIVNLPDLTYDKKKKTPSQRLRESLYVLWVQKGKPNDFQTFYDSTMEKIISQVQERLT